LYRSDIARSKSQDKESQSESINNKSKVAISSNTANNNKKKKSEVDEFVTRLTYEYIDINEKKKTAM
jgi:hypothetical protein